MIRSILLGCFLGFIALAAFFSGVGEKSFPEKKKLLFQPLIKGIEPYRDVEGRKPKSFAIVIYAHNAVDWCERSLRSVFEQDYERYRVIFVDDGSVDGTYEKAKQFIVQNHQDSHVIAIRNETSLGPVGCLYRAADYCHDLEILMPLDAKNWLSHDKVLFRLNQIFQNPDTWIALSQSIQYPDYQIIEAPALAMSTIEKKGFRSLNQFNCPFSAFYAGLFKSIHLQSLLIDGEFSNSWFSCAVPLLELSGGRFRIVAEPLTFVNESIKKKNLQEEKEISVLQSQEPYRPLVHFPQDLSKDGAKIDVIIFSFDRPIQLYAALESIQHYITGYQNLKVLYRVSDNRFNDAYNLLAGAFPKVQFIKQSDNPHKDFKPLLIHAIFDSPADFILFGVDDIIVTDFVDLHYCQEMLKKTGAYGFYLRFGRHIHQSYIVQKPQAVPPSIALSNGVYAWDFRNGEWEWHYPNSLDMTLYRKTDLKKAFSELKYKHPKSLEHNWAENFPSNTIGLYFDHSKMVNIPLNILRESDHPHMNFLTTEELLQKFNQGYKIDISVFYQIDNPSPHCDYIPEFIPR